jgi:hypothetical protein
VCDVAGFHPAMSTIKDVPIRTCVCTFDSPTRETYILVIGQALYFGDQTEHSLLSPNQVRAFSHKLCLNPKQYSDVNSIHGTYSDTEDFMIPFNMYGCISYVPIRRPTPDELNECRHICLEAEEECNPYSEEFAKAEKVFQTTKHIYATSSLDHRSSVSPDELVRRWGTSLDVATKNLEGDYATRNPKHIIPFNLSFS